MIVKRLLGLIAALTVALGIFATSGGFASTQFIPIASASTGDGDCNWQDC